MRFFFYHFQSIPGESLFHKLFASDHHTNIGGQPRNPYRKQFCIKCTTLLSFVLATSLVLVTHILIALPQQMTKAYLENTMNRIEHRTRTLLRPYRRSRNESVIAERELAYDSSIKYGDIIYANKTNFDHATWLVTNSKCENHLRVLILITSGTVTILIFLTITILSKTKTTRKHNQVKIFLKITGSLWNKGIPPDYCFPVFYTALTFLVIPELFKTKSASYRKNKSCLLSYRL